MPLGQPYLAVWSKVDNTVRLFQLSGSAFVQIGTTALVVGSDVTSLGRLFFSANGIHLLGVGKLNAAAVAGTLYHWDLSLTALEPSVSRPTTGAGVASIVSDFTKINNILFVNPATANYGTQLLASTGLLDTAGTPVGAARTYQKSSPDETCWYRMSAGVGAIDKITGRQGGVYPNASTLVPMPNSGVGVSADWTPDSKYLFVGCADGSIECWTWDGSVTSLTQRLAVPTGFGAITAVSVRPGGRFVAVGYYDGTTRRTVIYRRVGPFLKALQTFTGIGALLDWTQDGVYLIDGQSKVAYAYAGNNVFAIATGLLTNLPANVLSQAVSPHANVVTGSPLIYDLAVPAVINKTYDPAGLKFCLLDATAVYAHGATSAMAIKGGKEISGNNWPEGGKVVTNFHVIANAVGAIALADRMTQSILGTTGLDFRYGFLYDATNDTPLVFVDYGVAQHVDSAMTMVIDFSAPGIIQFAT